jgi:hypothetical protein
MLEFGHISSKLSPERDLFLGSRSVVSFPAAENRGLWRLHLLESRCIVRGVRLPLAA